MCLSSQQKAASPPEVPFFPNTKSPFTSPRADHTGASQGSSAHTLPPQPQTTHLMSKSPGSQMPVTLSWVPSNQPSCCLSPKLLELHCNGRTVTLYYYLSILGKSNAMEFNVSSHRWRHLLPDFKIILFNKRTHWYTPFENLDRFQEYLCVSSILNIFWVEVFIT